MKTKNSKLIYSILAGFAVLYALISLTNHYLIRTYALDLGAYTNALYDYSHFQWNDSSVFRSNNENLLADHFDLYLILFAPLSLLFKSYTLLIVQLFFLVLGGKGIYNYFTISNSNNKIAVYSALYFLLFYGVYSALSFDYHSNVVSASMVPWLFYFIKKNNPIKTSLVLIFIIIGKENLSLWMAFICMGLLIEYRKNKFWKNYLTIATLACLSYFVIITSVVMPSIANPDVIHSFQYTSLGDNYFEVLIQLIKHPIDSLSIIFTNHTSNPQGDYLKLELFIILICSGLFFLVKKPYYLLMLIPIFGQKLLHDNISMWGIHSQYSIEFAPIMAIGIFTVIGDISNKKLINFSSIFILLLCIFCTIRVMDNTVLYSNKAKIRVYQGAHYSRNYPTKLVKKELNKIPKDAIVSAQSPFVAQLAYRDHIYQYPMVKNATYIVLSLKEQTYPITEDEFASKLQALLNSKDWVKETELEGFYIFKRHKKT